MKNKALLLEWIELNVILEVLFFVSSIKPFHLIDSAKPHLLKHDGVNEKNWSLFWHKVPEFDVEDKFGVLSSWGLPLLTFIDSAIHSLLF